MSTDTRSSRRASERRRKRVLAAGVAGVAGAALLTTGAIAYWPDAGSPVRTTASAPRVGLPNGDSTRTPTADDLAPVAATSTPSATREAGSITSRSSTRSPATPVAAPNGDPASSAPASTPPPPPPSQSTEAAPAPSATAVPLPVETHDIQKRKRRQTGPRESAPTSSPTTTTPTPTRTTSPTTTPTTSRCLLLVLC